jgi:hypothetical protein
MSIDHRHGAKYKQVEEVWDMIVLKFNKTDCSQQL